MTHYDDYPYPAPGKDIGKVRTDRAPHAGNWWWPEEPCPKNVLVAGCGVYEAAIIAKQEPLLKVLAIDNSERTLDLATAVAMEAGVTNVSFAMADLSEFEGNGFDLVISSGVMHHISDPKPFIRNMWRALK